MAGLGVADDLKRSILKHMHGPHFLYKPVLKEMAELADRNYGRELTVTPLEIADRLLIDRYLREEERVAPIAKVIDELKKVGIVELVSEEAPSHYRFPDLCQLTEIGNAMETKEVYLPPILIPFRERGS